MRHRAISFVCCALSGVLLASTTLAGPISLNDTVVVLRVGEGSAAFNNAAAVFLEEYAIGFNGAGVPTSATHVQTIPVPATGTDPGTKLTVGGTASLEGGLNFSTNGQYLMFAGSDAIVGDTLSGKRKIVGRLDLAGSVSLDAIYGTGTTAAGNAIRTVTSATGNEYWFGESGTATAPGVGYRTWEGGNNAGVNSVLLSTQNARRLEIYNNQLYIDSAVGASTQNVALFGVGTVGSGTPTSGTQTVTPLPGMPTTGGTAPTHSPVDFFFADANTLYVADDRTTTSGGLQKWVFDSDTTTWSLVYTKNIVTTNSFNNGLRGLTGGMVGADGTVTLFGSSTFGTSGGTNFLLGISDTLANTNPANVIVNSLASSASIPGAGGSIANFRGLEAIGIKIPEPGSLGLLAVGSLLLLAARRRKA